MIPHNIKNVINNYNIKYVIYSTYHLKMLYFYNFFKKNYYNIMKVKDFI